MTVRRSLFLAFTGLVLLLFIALFALSLRSTDRILERVLAPTTEHALAETSRALSELFLPITRRISVDQGQIAAGRVVRYDNRALVSHFLPALRALPQVGSMMISDESGYQFLLMKYDRLVLESPLVKGHAPPLPDPAPDVAQFFTREFRPAEWGRRSVWTLYDRDDHTVLAQWERDLPDYDTKSRPWHRLALQRAREVDANCPPANRIAWTESYQLFTTKTLGISASVAVPDPSGTLTIVAYDLLLEDVSLFTRRLRPTPGGRVFVATEEGRIIGVPGGMNNGTPEARQATLLRPLNELGVPAIAAAHELWRVRSPAPERAFRFEEEGDAWWASLRRFPVGAARNFVVGVVLPEAELAAETRREQISLLLLGLLALGVATFIALLLARSFSEPLLRLVQKSRRIASLELAESAPSSSSLREVQLLERSLEQMRASLERHLRELASETAARVESEGRFRLLAENAVDAFFLVAGDGTILDMNRSACSLLGYPREELLGRSMQEVDPAWPGDQIAGLKPGEAFASEGAYRGRAGTHLPVEVRGCCLAREGGNYFLAAARDISRRRQLEEQVLQAQKMEVVGRLAGGIAHDFNNVLTAVLGQAALARQLIPKEHDAAAHLEELERASTRAMDLTTRLLAFSRRQISEPRVLDLGQTLPELATVLRRLLGDDVELRLAVAPGTSAVRIDPMHLQQVLVNLAINARDAMPQGGELSIDVSEEAGQVVIAVRDEGTGIPPEVRAQIFQPFFTTKEVGKGTGLGLSISLGIVEQAGGTMEVRSEPGSGSTFRVLLPRTEGRADVLPPAVADWAQQRGTETVLVVDDEDLVRQLIGSVLEMQGYRVLLARDGASALELARPHEGVIHLLVSDVVMPRMTGQELAHRLMVERPGLRVILTSGFTDHPAVIMEELGGASRFLPKPFSPEQLCAHVRSSLDACSG